MNNINQANSLVIHTDGASRNNPGRAAIGVVIADKSGKVVDTISRCIGITTNNQAEYMAVIAGWKRQPFWAPGNQPQE
jgi:ribonuclease HI